MKKIAISTIFNVCNYGTVLQAYATQQLLNQLGYKSEIIKYIPKRVSSKNVLLKSGDSNAKSIIRNIASIVVRMPGNILIRKVFNDFIKEHLVYTESKYETVEQIRNNLPVADIFLTGSDQVWNSKYNEGIDYVYYLDFLPSGKKR
ncbi:polysaccharide pyruvyl transferase family protein, partial [Acetoanaerobium noterae]|uniref:polysaccharide pyruvyl transferase family protein n=1 Tax=Acetoanaerobium noterae TaxID=745369 RepID=UPI0032214A76